MAKMKNPILPKSPSSDALELAKQLLEVADTDLRAALTLHGATCFSQAVFYLQQAVEKVGKAYGLALGLAEPAELQKEWSHNTLKHSELFLEYGEQQGLMPSGAMVPEEIRALMKKLRDPDAIDSATMDLQVEWALSLVRERSAYNKQSKQHQDHLAEMTRLAVGALADSAEIARGAALAECLADLTVEQALIVPTTMVLGTATLPHAVRARYPLAGMTPLERYTASYPVVRVLPELCTISSGLIVSVRTICALVARTKTLLVETT